ncbi:hypothetical protein JG688_00016152 [Phytophthora aleatoria]|uniref:Uncharacterized protein n=1 Tax=Phytophthora aleatoria TaxID=2496075 RepID=A0A8J5IEM1_9STRA|nr:hypothetical protein JG688_00016152 [Phytophthora aleatoria]
MARACARKASGEAHGELRLWRSGAAATLSDAVSAGGDGLYSSEREETGRFLRTGTRPKGSAESVQSKQEAAHASLGSLFVDDVSSEDVESSGSIVFGERLGERRVSVKLATGWRLPWHEMK